MKQFLGTVVDLFSGAGGISYGFFAHPSFEVVGAADAEIGKPSTGEGAIQCNRTYEANIKVKPLAIDLGGISTRELREAVLGGQSEGPTVLLACPPCTGFSRAVSANYVRDDPRNSLVRRVADFAADLEPDLVFMENVPQLVNGNFRWHFDLLRRGLERLDYTVHAGTHVLSRFGLPQARERALIIAVRGGLLVRTLNDLWKGYEVSPDALTVRRAISHLKPLKSGETDSDDPVHTSTLLAGESLARISAIPRDGGSWPDLLHHRSTHKHLIPSMWAAVNKGRLNSYRDVYGRLSWDRPSPTIKRECSHVGNGRYSHPEQNRQCTVRELALLQGFPDDYRFLGASRKNLYRQVGDAVPPLISYQLAWLAHWILTDIRPPMHDILLPGTSLTHDDIRPSRLVDYEPLTLC